MEFNSDYYNEGYFTKHGDRGWYDEKAFALDNLFHKKWAEFLAKEIPIKEGTRILDVGCARGNVVYWFNDMGYDCWGVDISEWAIYNAHTYKVVQANIVDKIPCSSNWFDYIITRETLEHISIDKIDKTIQEMYRVLKIGGTAVISTATNRGMKEDKKRDNPNNVDPSHILIKSPYWWVERFRKCGFKHSYEDYMRISSEEWPLLLNWDIMIFKKG